MRQLIKDFIKIASETLPINEPIYEFGSLQVSGQEGFADLRTFFLGKEYVGCDLIDGPGVERILNIHKIDLPSESVGTVIIADTLEHVEFVRNAMDEVYRILKPEGIVIMSSVMNFPIHNFPEDYWRFTPEGFKSLLRIFPVFFVDSVGNSTFPHTVVGIGRKSPVQDSMDEFKDRIFIWKQHYDLTSTERWKKFLKLFVPPLFLQIYGKIRDIKMRQIPIKDLTK
jgi:SAM-dependent methyltransferase